MPYLGILVATIAAFVISTVYYSVAPPAPPALAATAADHPRTGRPGSWQLAVEVVRSALVAALVAGILVAAGWNGVVKARSSAPH
jgi:hypothetical protein